MTKPFKGGALARQAGMFCLNDRFQEFLFSCHEDKWKSAEQSDIDTGAIAAIVLRQLCGIKSRAEIDHNKEAAKKFGELMKQYNRWCQGK
jgi:hypothetical protein